MADYQRMFVNELTEFAKIIYSVHQSPSIEKLLLNIDCIDAQKFINKFIKKIIPVRSFIINKDTTLFTKPFYPLPEVNLSAIWNKFSMKQRDQIFDKLKRLTVICSIIQPQTNNAPAISQQQKIEQPKEFNPYIGTGQPENISLESMSQETPVSTGTNSNPLMNMIGNNINMADLSQQLKNIDPKELENVSNGIKSMLGTQSDPESSNLIGNMIGNIFDELKNSNFDDKDPMAGLMHVAENVAKKIIPTMKDEKIDKDKLLQSAMSMSQNMGLGNPMSMLSQMFPKEAPKK